MEKNRVHSVRFQGGFQNTRFQRSLSQLSQGNIHKAFRHLRGWYRSASDVVSRPCFLALERQTQDREELYGRVPPPGAPIPININPSPILDSIPTDPEIHDVVQSLRFGRAGGTSKIYAEDIRGWIRGVLDEEDPKLPKCGRRR